jgi:hypothetical protein
MELHLDDFHRFCRHQRVMKTFFFAMTWATMTHKAVPHTASSKRMAWVLIMGIFQWKGNRCAHTEWPTYRAMALSPGALKGPPPHSLHASVTT